MRRTNADQLWHLPLLVYSSLTMLGAYTGFAIGLGVYVPTSPVAAVEGAVFAQPIAIIPTVALAIWQQTRRNRARREFHHGQLIAH